VVGKTLSLVHYSLSKGQFKALASAIKMFDCKKINRAMFDNCGMIDDDL
jgi:hypothetical protein